MKTTLTIKSLCVAVDNTPILKNVSLDVSEGTVVALMGPNGSGKSTLAYTIMGHPRYTITDGSIECDGQTINNLTPDKRAKLGIFLAMQQPVEIEGIPLKDFLRQAYNTLYDGTPRQLRLKDFNTYFNQKLELLNLDQSFAQRSINVGFSGGQKKQADMLQLAVLQPKIAILDEIDSGLDVDALKIICEALNTIRKDNPTMAILLITHYKRILDCLTPDIVHVMRDGSITKTGNAHLADHIEKHGYE